MKKYLLPLYVLISFSSCRSIYIDQYAYGPTSNQYKFNLKESTIITADTKLKPSTTPTVSRRKRTNQKTEKSVTQQTTHLNDNNNLLNDKANNEERNEDIIYDSYLSLKNMDYSIDTFYRKVYLNNKVLKKIDTINITNDKLFSTILSWLGNKYKYGGSTTAGIDCSALMVHFMNKAYGIPIPRTAAQEYNQAQLINKAEIQEGDLVFFKLRKHHISHVGMYLDKNYFIHAGTSTGVTFSSLDESYWQNKTAGYGHFEKQGLIDYTN